jgi:hypothetical protein
MLQEGARDMHAIALGAVPCTIFPCLFADAAVHCHVNFCCILHSLNQMKVLGAVTLEERCAIGCVGPGPCAGS